MTQFQFCYYADHGAVDQFLAARLEIFCRPLDISVVPLRRHDVRSGYLQRRGKDILAFFLPGNRAGKNYLDGFGPLGHESIKNYVALGGCFVGICAGGYLGGAIVDYVAPELTRRTASPLGMLPGTSVGVLPLLDPVVGERRGWDTASVVNVDFSYGGALQSAAAIYWGGGAYQPAPGERVETLATYRGLDESLSKAAVVGGYGFGRVVLSGIHAEMTLETMMTTPRPFVEYSANARYVHLMEGVADDNGALDRLFMRLAGQAFRTERGQRFCKKKRALIAI